MGGGRRGESRGKELGEREGEGWKENKRGYRKERKGEEDRIG